MYERCVILKFRIVNLCLRGVEKMSEKSKKGIQAIKSVVSKGAASVDVDALKEKALKASETIGDRAQEIKESALGLKEDIAEKLTELDRMLESSITEYNDAYTLMNDKLVLPAILVSEDSVIRMTMPDGSVIEDWKVSSVDRPNKNDASTFEATYTSKEWSKAQLEDGQTFLIVIYSSEESA